MKFQVVDITRYGAILSHFCFGIPVDLVSVSIKPEISKN